jgi:hypothetical protein
MGIIKEAEFATCGECGSRRRVADEVRGCDVCKKVFADEEPYLSADIFRKDTNGAERLDCCSWICAFNGLRSIETDYFVSLPYLHYDEDTPVGQRAIDFFEALDHHAPLTTEE